MHRAIALVACLIFALAVAPADAKKKHKKKPIDLGRVATVTVPSNVTNADGQEATATATCPAGLNAVSGGFTSPLTPGSAVPVHDSYMSSPTTWTVSGRNFVGRGGVSATVYCRKTTRAPVTDVASSVLVPGVDAAVGTAAPTCPGASRAISGGFQSTTGTNAGDMLFPKSSLLTSVNTWTVTSINVESTQSFTLTGHAYCMSRIRPPKTLSATVSVPAVQNTSTEASTPVCPAPKKAKKKKGKKKRKKQPAQLLSAGGFSTPLTTLANPPQAAVGASVLGTSGGWFGSVTNATNGVGTLSLTTQGVCV